jgi:xanthine dehydrogenase accessory factor
MKTWPLILQALEEHGCCAMVSVVKIEGSAPREEGARMIGRPDGFHGTIGGGALEWRAISAAQALFGRPPGIKLSSHALGPELGQCCGGRVQLATETFDRSSLDTVRELARCEAQGPFTQQRMIGSLEVTEHFGERRRTLYLFGAGHVGKALVLALAPLPFAVRWIDPRPESFPQAVPQNVTPIAVADPAAELTNPTSDSFALIMTHSHALDLAITDAALRNERIAQVGLIGSTTKRARFEKRLREAGVPEARIATLICPIGLTEIKSKHPAMIAASTAAQLIILNEQLKANEAPLEHHLNLAQATRGAGR